MYHSKHNPDVTYFFTWGKPIKVSGNGVICKEDTNIGKPENWTQEYINLYLEEGITEVKKGFLESFSNLKLLILDQSVQHIEMTDQLQGMLKNNGVVIRGFYNTYAEKFAKENDLQFLHKDIFVARKHFAEYCETREVSIVFEQDGKIELLYEDFCVGISAGNTMGGEFRRKMPEEFHKGCTLEEFAYMMPAIYFDQILQNKELETFLDHYAMRKEQ